MPPGEADDTVALRERLENAEAERERAMESVHMQEDTIDDLQVRVAGVVREAVAHGTIQWCTVRCRGVAPRE